MIGIIAAMESEMNILREALNCNATRIHSIDFYEGVIGKTEIVLCSSGVGKVNAAMAATIMIDTFECELIINTGIAGGITGVETKDIVLATGAMYSDVDATAFGYAYGQIPQMPKVFLPSRAHIVEVKHVLKLLGYSYKEALVYSGDSFVSSPSQVKNVDTSISCIAEMEGAAIAQVCTKAGRDFIILRYISDCIGKPNQIEDYQKFESEMSERSSRICLEILKNLA